MGILGSLFLLAMACLDRNRRWFRAAAGGVMLVWNSWTVLLARRRR
jgi:hypothetical protein